jgi:protein-L-isoaspartate(D-aspartate) O-methyltransferase
MNHAAQRRNMVESQLRPNRVTDERILDAMGTLAREAFVPKVRKGIAYVDEALPIGGGRYLMEPMVVARLLQAAEVKPTDVALHIGCGSGYAAAVMAKLASTVVAVESDPALAKEASRVLAELGIDTVAVIEAPMTEGYPKQAPYDIVFFDGAVTEIPDRIANQLAENGRLVTIVAHPPRPGAIGRWSGKGILMTRFGGVLSRREIFDAGTPILPGFERKPVFVF